MDVEIELGSASVIVLQACGKQFESPRLRVVEERSVWTDFVAACHLEYGRVVEIKKDIHFAVFGSDAVFEHVADDGFGHQGQDGIRGFFSGDADVDVQPGIFFAVVQA